MEMLRFLRGDKHEFCLTVIKFNDSDGAHMTSFGIEFQTEEAKENQGAPSVVLLCAGLLRRGMVYELDQVLWVCDGFFGSISVTYDGAVLL